MKRIILLFFMAVLTGVTVSAQTPFYTEDFTTGQNWNLEDNWSIETGTMKFSWSPTITNFDLSAISQEIELPDTVREMIINQYLDVFSTGNPPEYAEVCLITPEEETVIWEYSLANGSWGTSGGELLTLDISDFGGEMVRFKFRTHGPTTFNWNYWYIYDFTLTSVLENDLAVVSLDGTTLLTTGETGTWDLDVCNLGSNVQNGFSLRLWNIKDGSLLDEITVSDEIQPQETKNFALHWTPENVQNTAVWANIDFEGDQYPGNNNSRSCFARVAPDMDISIFVWDNDNDIQTILDPEQGDIIYPSQGVTRALDAACFTYDFGTSLPVNYMDYDIIFATMGCYCLS